MPANKIISEWKKKVYKPFYWLEGEEDYYIDRIIDYAEKSILTESEASFNLTVFYGRDADWAEIMNACRRYPMFSELQVVIIKEAQLLKDIEKLEPYFEQPLSSTVLVIGYKNKKLDNRKKLARLIKTKGELVSTKKLYESELPEWVNARVKEKGLTITPKAAVLLVEHIGNNLSRIENEIDKIRVNMKEHTNITDAEVENFIGISKDYNIFELQHALAVKNISKVIQVIQYFGANAKANPIQVVLPSLHSFFSKCLMTFGAQGPDQAKAQQIGVSPYFYKTYSQAVKLYGYEGIERALLLLHHYNLKSIGIHTGSRMDEEAILKEMLMKIML